MVNEALPHDGVLDFRDYVPDMYGYRSVQFKKVPPPKKLPIPPKAPPESPGDYIGPKAKYLLLKAGNNYYFVVKKSYALHCSQTIKWMLSNPYGYQDVGTRLRNNMLDFSYIAPYYMYYVCKYFNWSYYYGVTNLTIKPPLFYVPKKAARKLQEIANFLAC